MVPTSSSLTIAVLGANGRSGRAFVRAALAVGHNVRAGVHSGDLEPAKNLKIFKTDATSNDQVVRLIAGSNVVVSLIGHVKGSPKRVQTEATETILGAMQQLDIDRLISLTGTGVRLPGDTPSMLDRLLNIGIRLVDPQRIQDGVEHAELLEDSASSWTLVRVLKLSNAPSKAYLLTEHGPAKLLTSRTEVAEAILEVIRNQSFIRQAPVISRLQS